MFRNYFKTAIRSFLKQKGFTFINITGLAIGLASSMLIFLYIFDELSFDTIHPEAQNIYRLGQVRTWDNGQEQTLPNVPGAWGIELKKNFPEVVEATRFMWIGYPASVNYKEGDKILLTESIFWVESTYPEMFYFPLEKGNKKDVFALPNSIAINQSTATRFFGEEDPVGKSLILTHPFLRGEELDVQIGGVFEDYPSNSHIQPDYLVNAEILRRVFGEQFDQFYNNWSNGWMRSYIKTAPGADIGKITTNLGEMLEKNLAEDAKNFQPFFKKVTDLHFDSEVQWVNEGAGDKDYIFIFGSIAILILIIASINYMNLATARSTKRAREIGLRKTVGGSRQQLISQFLGESFLTVILAAILSLGIIMLILPLFNRIAQKSFTIISLFDPVIMLILLGSILLLTLLAGFYPALYLSHFKPIDVLRGQVTSGKNSEAFRKILVIFQFSISMILMISSAFFLNQMTFLNRTKLADASEQVISIRYGGIAPAEKYPAYKAEVIKDPEISYVTMANHLPRQEYFGSITNLFRFPGLSGNDYEWSLLNVDGDFVKSFDLDIIAGRGLGKEDEINETNYLINEAGLISLGIDADQALGLALNLIQRDTTLDGKIVGVVRDFPYESMRQAIGPLLISTRPHPINKIVYVKVPSSKINEKIAYLEETWKSIYPGVGFDYWFLSDEFSRMYVGEKRMASLTRVFSILAILVACLGVFGLASYMAERRNREIGIRKVLGASVSNILVLLSRTFVFMLIISTIIAIPVAWYLMSSWLQNFVYHIDLVWWIFAGAVGLVSILTIITISYETLKAARLNPAEYIRDE